MKKLRVSSVTVEEAVGLLINLDYIPTGFTLLDMTSAFLEEAEANHYNAKISRLPDDQIAALQIRVDACAARHSLAQSLASALRNEINKPDGVIAEPNNNSVAEPQLTVESLISWASGIGIGLPVLALLDDQASVEESCWEDVEIKIYRNYRIAFSINDSPFKRSSFRNIGLMGARKNKPNDLGNILITLSQKKKYPAEETPQNKHAAAISKLRSALKKLTGISGELFHFNAEDGYKPRFTLIDDRRNADERAKERAVHEPYDDNQDTEDTEDTEAPNFEDKNDAAGEWIKQNE